MENATALRISRLKVKRDKFGMKYATIRLESPADSWQRTDSLHLRCAIEAFQRNPKMIRLKLSDCLTAKSLTFFTREEPETSQECATPVDLLNFHLERAPDEPDWIFLSFEFTVPLEFARRWLIGQIGDDLLCAISNAQLSLGKNA